MRSPWVWMMVLVALGSAQKPPKQTPNINIQKLKGIWHPLATAHSKVSLKPTFEFKINPKDDKSFEIMVLVGKLGVCEKKTAIATASEGGFRIDSKLIGDKMFFMETNYTNYHILYISYGGDFTLYLYGRKKVVTEDMKTRFIRTVSQHGINPINIDFYPRIECSF